MHAYPFNIYNDLGVITDFPDIVIDLDFHCAGSQNYYGLGEGCFTKQDYNYDFKVFNLCSAIHELVRPLGQNWNSDWVAISSGYRVSGSAVHIDIKIEYDHGSNKIRFSLNTTNGIDYVEFYFNNQLTDADKSVWIFKTYGGYDGFDSDGYPNYPYVTRICSMAMWKGDKMGGATIASGRWGSPPQATLNMVNGHDYLVSLIKGTPGTNFRRKRDGETQDQYNDYVDSFAESCGICGTIRMHNLNNDPIKQDTLTNAQPIEPPTPDDPYPPDDPPVPPVPDPDPDPDPIPIPDLPTRGAGGLINLYSPSLAQLENIADELYDTNVWQIIENFFNSPMDLMVGLSLMPFAIPTSGTAKPKVGLFTFTHAMPVVSEQFIEIDCGSLDVKAFYGTAFDYSPYTKIEMWLPFIGYQEIDVDEVMGNLIEVKYHIDVLSGSCIAFILSNLTDNEGSSTGVVIAQYSGNCAVQIPFSGQSYDHVISDAINMLTGIAATASGGTAAGALVNTAQGVSNSGGEVEQIQGMKDTVGTVADTMGHKPTVIRNGVAGSSCGYMGIMYPYLIKKVPWQSKPEGYADFKGYPCNKSTTLSQLTGYAEVDDIHLNNIPATEPEVAEIYRLLRGGILL